MFVVLSGGVVVVVVTVAAVVVGGIVADLVVVFDFSLKTHEYNFNKQMQNTVNKKHEDTT